MAIEQTARAARARPWQRPPVVGGALIAATVAGLLAYGASSGGFSCITGMGAWSQLVISGLTLGVIYAMIALGYTMVYGVLQLLNFAHSEIFMIGSFAGLYAIQSLFGVTTANHPNGIGGSHLILVVLVALLLGGVASGAVAVGMERVAYRPLRRRGTSRLGYLITAIGMSLFLQNLFLLMDGGTHLGFHWPNIAGAGPVSYPNAMNPSTAFTVLGTPVTNQQALSVVVAVVMLIVLDLFVRRTRSGKGMRAVAEDPETAALMGVNIDRVVALTFFVGGLMAGVAGVLYGMQFNAQFNMGFVPGIKAFTAAVLGGIGNVRGAMLGGVLLGLIENLGAGCLGTQWQEVIAFIVLVVVLMFRPTGLLGEQVGG